MTNDHWQITETSFDAQKQHHLETIFTIGNGYLCTRGAFEEGFLGDHRATFIHGMFDAAPIVFTQLVNAPDWLPVVVAINGERFSLSSGEVNHYQRSLDLTNGVLRREVHWQSSKGEAINLIFERFASLADTHTLLQKCQVIPEFDGEIELRFSLNGYMDNEGLLHWNWVDQGIDHGVVFLLNQTRNSKVSCANAMRTVVIAGVPVKESFCDVQNSPTQTITFRAEAGKPIIVEKYVSVFTSRDVDDVASAAKARVRQVIDWNTALVASSQAWAQEWERSDVQIEGDDEAQIAIRFNLFQMLIAAPRQDDRVNIGAKTLSGFGYRGHAFWDTEIFMLPLFTYTAPHIARNLLNYRVRNLPGARAKARQNGYEGAQFPWESADSGEEVTPSWVPHFSSRTKMVRIWTGDIEIHISADIAYAAWQYWKVTGDDAWMVEKGAELVLDIAKFWASRAEWDEEAGRYEYNDVIGPDEYHEHVDNNAFTNRMAQWTIQTALGLLQWLQAKAPGKANALSTSLDLSPSRLDHWRDVVAKVYLPGAPDGLIEQFEGYFNRRDVHLPDLEPRTQSIQTIFGIEGTNETQVLKQPDVLMLQYLLHNEYDIKQVQVNYDYYTARTDHTFGSSLGPSIQAIMACEVGKPEDAYEHFIRAVRADLRDVRGNAGDGIHGASAAGTWQAIVFGFGGLRVSESGWRVRPRLPHHWRSLSFHFFYHGQMKQVTLRQPEPLKGFIFDLDGVLTDTAEYHFQAWKQLADEEGIPFSRQDNEALRGVSRRESLGLLLKGKPISEEQAQAWMERKNNYYRQLVLGMTSADLLPGAVELLEQLHAAGFKSAIASASKNASDVLDRLGLWNKIDVLCDGNSVQNPKPAPDLFLFAANQLGLPPQACVVVEDAEAGIDAAIAAGMRSIGLGPFERVGRATLVLPSLDRQELTQLVQKLG